MKKILYYVTDHGLGHATRSIALIRELVKNDIQIIIRSHDSSKILHKSLPGIKILDEQISVGPKIKDDGISIDITETKKIFKNWIQDFEIISENETKIVSKICPDLIISDISPVPFIVGKNLNIFSIALSNFCWFDVLPFISKNTLKILKNAYQMADIAYQLPFGPQMTPFSEVIPVGPLSRIPTVKKESIRKQLNISKSKKIILFLLNKTYSLKLSNNKNVQIFCNNPSNSNEKLIPKNIEFQNLLQISDLVIAKLGYGIVSECVTLGIPLLYVFDTNHVEQSAISTSLKNFNSIAYISKNDLSNFDFENHLQKFDKPKLILNDNANLSNSILKLLK